MSEAGKTQPCGRVVAMHVHKESARNTGKPPGPCSGRTIDAGDGQAERPGVTERLVVTVEAGVSRWREGASVQGRRMRVVRDLEIGQHYQLRSVFQKLPAAFTRKRRQKPVTASYARTTRFTEKTSWLMPMRKCRSNRARRA